MLVHKLQTVDFVVYSVLMNPFVTQKFKLPEGSSLISVPLWGTEEPSEHLLTPFSHVFLMKEQTTPEVLKERFLPLFRDLILELISESSHPVKFGQTLLGLYEYFHTYEYKASFKSEIVWETYKEIILEAAADQNTGLSHPDIYGLVQSLGWVYRFFNIVNTPLPKVDVSHSSAAAFCGIPCVLSKLKYGTPFMLTEHGIYLREQYLSLSNRGYSSFLSKFLIRMVQSIVSLNYTYADQVSPVCNYNMRWESEFHVPFKRIKVIYNGVDPNIFTEAPASKAAPLKVIMIARIDPIKDIKTFIRAAQTVIRKYPEVQFVVYGSVSVQSYYEECLQLRKELMLESSFLFAGHATKMAEAYHSGDITVLSSISEAFPYSVVEAMMCGKPVIATDVGGVKEALGETGILVEPRNPQALADGISNLIDNRELRLEMGKDARDRALSLFTLNRVMELHFKSYLQLATRAVEKGVAKIRKNTVSRQQSSIEKALILEKLDYKREAVALLETALKENPNSPHVPYILTRKAELYNKLGEYDNSMLELVKCEMYIEASASLRIS